VPVGEWRIVGAQGMNTFDRHLMKEWLSILLLVLVAICGLLFVQICFDKFRDMMEAGAQAREFWRYLLVTLPSFLGVVIPLSLLVSLLFTLTKLHRANELVAMRAAGVGLTRLMAPVWVFGLLACGVVWWTNSTVVPWSVEQSRALDDELQFRRQARLIAPDKVGAEYSVAFDNSAGHRMWFFNRYSRALQRGFGVAVSQLDVAGRERTRIVAREAWYEPARREWTFRDGREIALDGESGIVMASVPFARKTEPDYHEDPALMLLTGQRPRDLSYFELRRLMLHFRQDHNPKGVAYAVRYYSLMADICGPLVVIAIAIPFAVTGVRVNPAVGVSKSIGLFFLYSLLNTVAASLATQGIIPPDLAAWLPNLGMAALAVWFFAKLR